MISDVQLQTAVVFFLSNLYLKQDIGSVHIMVDFIRKATKRCEERKSSENYKMKNSCPLWDSNPRLSAYEANALPLSYEE